MGRSANGWHEIMVVSKDGMSKGDLLGLREVEVTKRANYKLAKLKPVISKELSIPEKIMAIFETPSNKGKMFDSLEMYKEINKYFPGSFKGQTPEYTVSGTLSTMAKEEKIKVAKPLGSKSKYYI
jgi:hypothetical protein